MPRYQMSELAMFKAKRTHQASAIVTGAGSGIGRAFALELGRRGGRVVCSDINLSTAEETVSLIHAQGGKALAVRCDVTQLIEVEQLADQAEQWFAGPISLVINNAGVGAGGQRVGESSMADWQWVMNINMWGVIHGCHVFAPRLRAQGRGGIINVASTASFAAAPLMGAYNASKAAVLALSETLAAEFAGTDVAVTALCPTIVKTNIFADGRIDAAQGPLLDRLIKLTGVSADGVAITTLNALDRGQLYVMPQFDARMIWRFKRLMPRLYTRGAGLISRFTAPAA
jgi:NAD(P)-dependent dehydrogenase (short-subunit alcohol dehydrogenase family)